MRFSLDSTCNKVEIKQTRKKEKKKLVTGPYIDENCCLILFYSENGMTVVPVFLRWWRKKEREKKFSSFAKKWRWAWEIWQKKLQEDEKVANASLPTPSILMADAYAELLLLIEKLQMRGTQQE